MNLFSKKYGIIPACDVDDLDNLRTLVTATCSLRFIQGYKIGMKLMLAYGVDAVVKEVRQLTSLPIIYDHQKFGTDIPEICGGDILEMLKTKGIDAIIIFPFAGIESLKGTIQGCKTAGITPIVGAEMTHPGFFSSEGGYLDDDAPERIFGTAIKLGVNSFVVPGTKVGKIRHYVEFVSKSIENPIFLFPGIGKGQGGDIAEAFKSSLPHSSSAIVGRGIYASKDMKRAALELWETASAVL